MRRAIAEARRGWIHARPNPMVGAVIVRDDQVIATGYHARVGEAHAETVALAAAGPAARGAEVFVNLEPCSHHGRTPPCADALIRAGVRRVVAGMIDPNPRVSGRGLQRLRDAGIEVTVGVLGDACRTLNEDFIVAIQRGRPHVLVKLAMSLDGRIATRTGASAWITGAGARARVHALRAEVDAVIVGAETVVADNPLLTVRDAPPPPRAPTRVVFDSTLRSPSDASIFDVEVAPTIVLCTERASVERQASLRARGVEVVCVQSEDGRVDPRRALQSLASRGMLRVMVEGGGALVGSLFDAQLVDRAAFFYAPMIIGGAEAKPAVAGLGPKDLVHAQRATRCSVEEIDGDFLVVADFASAAQENEAAI